MRDPYTVLGVARTTSQADIKKAYHKLAKQLHPDRNPDNPKVAEQFKEISAAYDILGDADKRGKFDRGEIDAAGQARARGFGGGGFGGGFGARGPRGGARGPTGGAGGFGGGFDQTDNPEDFLNEIFGNFRRGKGGARPETQATRGADRHYTIQIGFVDAARGCKRRVTMPGGKQLDVTIPPGVTDGQPIRLKGQGETGSAGGANGDAIIEVKVDPHEFFQRQGDDVIVDLPVTLDEAVLGAKVPVPTVDGMVAVTVPKGASSGTQLRLKGRGMPKREGERGDQYIRLRIVLPEKPNAALEKAIEAWAKQNRYDVRARYQVD